MIKNGKDSLSINIYGNYAAVTDNAASILQNI